VAAIAEWLGGVLQLPEQCAPAEGLRSGPAETITSSRPDAQARLDRPVQATSVSAWQLLACVRDLPRAAIRVVNAVQRSASFNARKVPAFLGRGCRPVRR
jgi:hypothetical protein